MAKMSWEKLLYSDLVGQDRQGDKRKQIDLDKYQRDIGKRVLTSLGDIQEGYQRLVSSSPVRALQDKTQVFALDTSDFIRTRLTHSLEVSAIAEHIVDAIEKKIADEVEKREYRERQSDIRSVARTAGLLHDMGNPPFGHKGESVIKRWAKAKVDDLAMTYCPSFSKDDIRCKDLKVFEGNSQAIRILLRRDTLGDMADITVSEAVIGSLAKYTSCAAVHEEQDSPIWLHKPGAYYSEWEEYLGICSDLGLIDEKRMKEFLENPKNANIPRHPLAFVLEAADDIAYATADFEDAFSKGLITLEEIRKYKELRKAITWDSSTDAENVLTHAFDSLIDLLEKARKGSITYDEEYVVHYWMRHVREHLIYVAAFEFSYNRIAIFNGEFEGELLLAHKRDVKNSEYFAAKGSNYEYSSSEAALLVLLLKQYAKEYAHVSDDVKRQDLLAERYLNRLLDQLSVAALEVAFNSNEDLLIPESLRKVIEQHREGYGSDSDMLFYQTMRSVFDYVSLLTDSKAKELAEAYEQIQTSKEAISKN